MRKTPVLNSMYHIRTGSKIPYRNRKKTKTKHTLDARDGDLFVIAYMNLKFWV